MVNQFLLLHLKSNAGFPKKERKNASSASKEIPMFRSGKKQKFSEST
jgi:hypothetical protein